MPDWANRIVSSGVNEDVNAYVTLGHRGLLFLTFFNVRLNQTPTQASSGGLTEIYLDQGTYLKSFYSVLYAPSCVKVSWTGYVNPRLHHRVAWNNAVPKIVRECWRRC